jgi:hypothetical protein
VGKPVEALFSALPEGVSEKIHVAVKFALEKAAGAALWSLDNEHQEASPWWNKTLAGLSGAAGGALGLPGVIVELPVSTTIMMRAIADIARSEGFNLESLEIKQMCLEVFALGGGSDKGDGAESAYYAARSFLAETSTQAGKVLMEAANKAGQDAFRANLTSTQAGKWLAELIEKTAARFGIVITEKFAAQAVPVIGAVAGASINMMFTDYYQDMARGHFIVKRLEAKYGIDTVKYEYENLCKAGVLN